MFEFLISEYLLTTFDPWHSSEELHQSNMQTVCTQAKSAQSCLAWSRKDAAAKFHVLGKPSRYGVRP